MKKLRTILCLVAAACWALPSAAQYATTAFRLQSATAKLERTVGQTFTTSVTLPLNDLPVLSGLSLSGNASLLNEDDAYIGVTLLDTAGCEHLVYETYPLMADDLSCTLNDVALETAALDNVRPDSLKIVLRNARLTIDALHYAGRTMATGWQTQRKNLLASQKSYTLERLNQHLRERDMTWSVGETCYSSLTFDEKRRLLGEGFNLMGGFEYYTGGIFVMPGALSVPAPKEADPFVKEFDWRNRHGKNWMTPSKPQTSLGCWAFGAVGPFEAYINIYYNRLLNYDLSEQEVLSCSGGQQVSTDPITGEIVNIGGVSEYANTYIVEHGIVEETCFQTQGPFLDCSLKCNTPQDIFSVDSYEKKFFINNKHTIEQIDSIKSEVKKSVIKGPLSYGFRYDYQINNKWQRWGHVATLVGFKEIRENDTIHVDLRNESIVIALSGSPYMHRTAWIIKNNNGENWGDHGFAYIITDGMTKQNFYEISGKIHSLNLTDDDILVTDSDGDGYYYWGCSNKPTNLSSNIPNQPDGDDSNDNFGPMDEYGNLERIKLLPPIYIENIQFIYSDKLYECDVYVQGKGQFGIYSDVSFHKDATIIARDGGFFFIKGGSKRKGSVKNANVKITSTGYFRIDEGAILTLGEDDELLIEKGAEAILENCEIKTISNR